MSLVVGSFGRPAALQVECRDSIRAADLGSASPSISTILEKKKKRSNDKIII